MHVSPLDFRLAKANSRVFFTIKQIFFKIKWWLVSTSRTTSKGQASRMKNIDVIAAGLVMVGAINWGLAGLFRVDLVATLFGMSFGEVSPVSSVVYGLVGLAGLYQALTWKSIQRRWHSTPISARA
jgi:uncharacterized membrane protein YuzA (DUF378 family)